jgi:hypothetical protein
MYLPGLSSTGLQESSGEENGVSGLSSFDLRCNGSRQAVGLDDGAGGDREYQRNGH